MAGNTTSEVFQLHVGSGHGKEKKIMQKLECESEESKEVSLREIASSGRSILEGQASKGQNESVDAEALILVRTLKEVKERKGSGHVEYQ